MISAFIPSPPFNGIHIFGLSFHVYGIMYVLAVTAAILISRHEWERVGGDRELIYEAARWGFPAGLIGGRIYFLITTPSQVPPHWWGPFAVWDGGLGIWGGIAGGVAVGIWRLRRQMDWRGVKQFLNVCASCLPAAQAIGRIGNYFNQELYGKPSTLPWAVRINVEQNPPDSHFKGALDYVGAGHVYATFQPSFLYEMIWDLALAAFLIWLGRKRVVRAPGLFALYVAGYCVYRIFEETIRIDYSQYILGMRLNFWVAGIGTVAGIAWFAWIQWGPGAKAASAANETPTTVAR
ncbi:MAG: prolipoprotein diacylglyceryl transferase [Solirubrobacterales bacterium]|nr:prolipoprotein diacylglyceryl transferase [Solirubrobacterales bacterium]